VIRFKINPSLPVLPEDWLEQAQENIPKDVPFDLWKMSPLKHWKKSYPVLDRATATALYDISDMDGQPECYMFAIGAHFVSQEWTDAELKQWVVGIRGANGLGELTYTKKGKLTAETRAQLFVALTTDDLEACHEVVGFHHMEHSANFAMTMPMQELKAAAEKAGVEHHDVIDKAALVVALMEHIYDDVIEPVASS